MFCLSSSAALFSTFALCRTSLFDQTPNRGVVVKVMVKVMVRVMKVVDIRREVSSVRVDVPDSNVACAISIALFISLALPERTEHSFSPVAGACTSK